MSAHLEVQSGARAGASIPLVGSVAEVGRGESAQIRFDPNHDLAVSTRHAILTERHGVWYLSDAGSLNGTFVNGAPVHAETRVTDGDQIMFGAGGPTVVFRYGFGHPGTTQRLQALVRRERRRVFMVSAVALLVVTGVVAGSLVYNARQRAAFESERALWSVERELLQERVDSVLLAAEASVNALQGQVAGLSDALSRSSDEIRDVRTALSAAEASGDTTDVPALRRQLQAVTTALTLQQLAASLDFRSIEDANRSAIARIFVESAAGGVTTGTAFAVLPDGTLATAAHVVAPPDQPPARRIAIQFSDSEQVWPARLLQISDDADVALVKVDNIIGSVPVVRGLHPRADTLNAGVPVAVIGFPLGGDVPMPDAANSNLALPLVTAGVIDRMANGTLEVRGYGAAGASGSPLFDADGRVLAVLFGGRTDQAGQIVFGAPAAHVAALLGDTR